MGIGGIRALIALYSVAAAAFATIAGVKREHFRWTKGEDRLTTYASSPGKIRWFCSTCGAHLIAERQIGRASCRERVSSPV